jgi:hypothetical protein
MIAPHYCYIVFYLYGITWYYKPHHQCYLVDKQQQQG